MVTGEVVYILLAVKKLACNQGEGGGGGCSLVGVRETACVKMAKMVFCLLGVKQISKYR